MLFIKSFFYRRVPALSIIQNAINNFEQNGCVNCQQQKIGTFQRSPSWNAHYDSRSSNQLLSPHYCPNCCWSRSTTSIVIGVLKKNGNKSREVHKILDGDNFRCMEFCNVEMEKVKQDEYFITNIVFTDESSFLLLDKHTVHSLFLVRYKNQKNMVSKNTAMRYDFLTQSSILSL